MPVATAKRPDVATGAPESIQPSPGELLQMLAVYAGADVAKIGGAGVMVVAGRPCDVVTMVDVLLGVLDVLPIPPAWSCGSQS
jgi:hypothetical protein